MTVQECYQQIQGNYENVLKRLKTDERIVKFLELFFKRYYLSEVIRIRKCKNNQEIFKCVHDLKGMALNLGLTALQKAAQNLCEAVRYGEPSVDISPLYQEVTKEYQKVVDIIHVIMQEQNRSV